ncbi:MAG: FecR domain-containing protein [Planctomycetaceae bacterium]|nr:FecR domain-containing protein [Planctomycetaceae bacterium]
MTGDELRELIDAALEGEITEADFLRLEVELTVDAAARREYLDRVLLTTLLEGEARTGSSDDSYSAPSRNDLKATTRRWRWAFIGMAAACACLLLVIASQWTGQLPSEGGVTAGPSSSAMTAEQQSSGYAILSGEAAAVWGNGTAISTGGVVPPGEVHLQSGLAQFELFSGVTLVVEGEARFSILSPMEVSVVRGRIRARVPEPAQGFRMRTQAGEVIDLGTEFAVDVSADAAEVHVLDGEVEWHPHGLPSQRISEGSATRSSRQGEASLAARPQAFVDAAELRRRITAQQLSRREHWEATCETLSRDARLIAHYQLNAESVGERRLTNRAVASDAAASEGAVVAAVAAANRWGDAAAALDFSPAGSRVRVHVPGEYEHLTLICWVRINSLDRWYNSLFLTDGHEQGEPHWQIMDDGRLFFSVKKRDVFDRSRGERDKYIFYSPPFWETSLGGRWMMIATVYDADERAVTHYLDGQVLSRESIPDEYLVNSIRVGDASLCNWGLPERDQPRFAIRNLNGSLDEFLLFSAPLSEAEIRDLYEASRP